MTKEENEKRLERLKAIVSNMPDKPGSYQYYDEGGTIIYVGKAKNLKNRVSSYFHKEVDRFKTKVLVSKIHDITYTVVNTEEDALLLSLTSSTWQFWLEGPFLHGCLEAVDSNGAHYTAYHAPYIAASGPNTGHFRNAFWIQVDGIENDPEWIEITHNCAGWTLHVDLPGREEAAP